MAYTPPAEKEAPKAGKSGKDITVARARLQQAIEATNQNRIYQVEDLRFAAASPDNKYQWPEAIVRLREADPNGARPVLTLNKLPQHINQITNEQRQNRPSVKVSPVDDKADKEVAEVLTGVIRHIEYISDAETAYAVAGENQVIHGEGYIRVLTDFVDEHSFEQEITIHQVKNSFSVYMDPIGLQRDQTGRFCEWVFIVQDLSKDEFEREYPDAAPVNWELVGQGDEWKAWFPDSDTVRIAEYFCYVYEDRSLHLFDVMGVPTIHMEGEPMPQGVVAGMQPIKTRKTKVRRVMWQKMNGTEVIEERDWAGTLLPVVRAAGNEFYIDGKMAVSGIVRNAKDAQRMFNYWKSTECETLALAPKAPFVGPAEAFEGFEDDWQNANIKNFPFLKFNQFTDEGKEIKRPERQIPPMPPVGIVNAALGAADDIKSTTGQYDPSLGNNPQAKSGIALQREQRKTDIGTFHYIDNQSRAIKQLGRVLVDLIPKIYDTRRVARILGEDGEPDHAVMDPDAPQAVSEQRSESGEIEKIYNPSIGRYDVTVSVGPGFASKRQEAADLMAQVLQGNKELMSVMGDLYFGLLDVPGADKIAERLKKTLPPGLAEPEEGEDGGPQVLTPRGPVSVEEAGQIIAQLEQANTQATELLESKEIEAQDAKTAAAANDAAKLELDRQKEATAQAKAIRELSLKEYAEETKRIDALVKAAEKGINPAQIAALAGVQMEHEQAEDTGADFVSQAALAAEAARPQPTNGGEAAGAPA